MARVALPESKMRARRRRRRGIFTVGAIVIFLLVVGGLVWLSHTPFLRITEVTVSGEQTISSSTIKDFVQTKLAGSYWYLFAKDNIFLYPKSTIDTALPAAMPVIAHTNTHAVNFHTIEVSVVERQPKALWCGTSVDASSSNCLLLDQGGVAYGSSNFSIVGQGGDGYKKYYGALTGSTTPEQYLTPDSFRALGALIDTFAQNQPQDAIVSIVVDKNGDVRAGFASGFTLLFALSSDGGDVYSRFMLALQSGAFKGHSIAEFQYLDLRFGDRLYYKLKGQ